MAAAVTVATSVTYAVTGRVAVITLNRPDRLNAWTPGMEQAWFAALDAAAADPEVRAVVATGAGRAFCAGLDAELIGSRSSGAERAPTRSRPLSSVVEFPKPLIGAVNGPAVGLGMALALFCDVRFAAPSARFVTMFARLGLTSEFGATKLLPLIVGRSVALDLLLSARPVQADEALALRLVDRVVPAEELLDAAVAYAAELADRCSPRTMAAVKELMLADAERPLAQSEAESSLRNRSPRGREEFGRGAAAARERRSPDFPPLPPDDAGVRRWLGTEVVPTTTVGG